MTKNNTVSNMKWLIKNSFAIDKPMFVYLGFYIVFKSIPDISLIIGSRYLLDSLMVGGAITDVVKIVLTIAAIYAVTTMISKYFYNISWPRYIVIRMKLKKIAAKKYVTLKQSTLEDPEMLNLCERAERATTENDTGYEGMFRSSVDMFSSLISLATCFFLISSLNVIVSLIIPILVITSYVYNVRLRNYEKKVNDELIPINRMNEYFFNSMMDTKYAKDIRVFELLPVLVKKINGNIKVRRDKMNRMEEKRMYFALFNALINVGLELILYIWLIDSVLHHGMSIGVFTMSAAAVRSIFTQFNDMLGSIAHIRQQSLLLNDFIELLDYEEPGIKETVEEIFEDETECENYEIEVRNVSFRYPQSDTYALKDINLKIKAGDKIAIVGSNGSGKTTFVKLLTRLYEPTEGEILLNGKNINQINRFKYYRLFSTVFQDIVLFAFPVIENISIQPKEQTDYQKVVRCCQDALIHDKIMTFEKDYDTSVLKIIDEDGIDFSGGEKQKVALARSIYRDSNALILDEPSANLDAIAENNVYQQYNQFAKGKSSIFISHRLASTQFCDMILLFDHGTIVERGTHEELMSKQGLYTKMFNIQAKNYNDGDEEE